MRTANKQKGEVIEKILKLNGGAAAKFIILTVFPYMLNSSRKSREELPIKLMVQPLPLSEL